MKCKAGWAARKASVAPEGHPVTLVKMFRGIPDFRLWDMAQISDLIGNPYRTPPDSH